MSTQGQYANGNTIVGQNAGSELVAAQPNITSQNNSFFGANAGMELANGSNNESSGFGVGALENTINGENSMFGAYAGQMLQGTGNVGCGNWNLRFTVNGNSNTAGGYKAMAGTPNEIAPLSNGNPNQCTAFGRDALRQAGYSGTNVPYSPLNDTAVGYRAGYGVTSENNNTFLGANTDISTAGISHATAVGADAKVAQSNTVILGRTVADSGPDFVGIGTNTPTAALHVVGDGLITGTLNAGATTVTDLVVTEGSINNVGAPVGSYVANVHDYAIISTNGSTITLPGVGSSVPNGQTFVVINKSAVVGTVTVNSVTTLVVGGSVSNGTGASFIYYAADDTYYPF